MLVLDPGHPLARCVRRGQGPGPGARNGLNGYSDFGLSREGSKKRSANGTVYRNKPDRRCRLFGPTKIYRTIY